VLWRPPKSDSPTRQSAGDLVARLFGVVATLDEVHQRGIVVTLDDAQLSEPDRRKLVAGLLRARDRIQSSIAAIGDDRRARGIALPLCWLPGDENKT
jgi:hypothetical protein